MECQIHSYKTSRVHASKQWRRCLQVYPLTLKSSMSSSCKEPAGDGVADSGCSGVSEWCLMFSPPRSSASSDWLIVDSWLLPKRPWLMSPSWTSMVMGDELLKCEPLEFPSSCRGIRTKKKVQTTLSSIHEQLTFKTHQTAICVRVHV